MESNSKITKKQKSPLGRLTCPCCISISLHKKNCKYCIPTYLPTIDIDMVNKCVKFILPRILPFVSVILYLQTKVLSILLLVKVKVLGK